MSKVSLETKSNPEVSESQRYEVKMVFDGLHLAEIRSWVLSHTNAFRKAFPPRQVNNIYFDTRALDLLVAHVDGVPERAKLRFRWYGKTWLARDGQLEIKKKNMNLGHKQIQIINGEVDISQVSWREFLAVLMSRSPENFQIFLQSTVPVLINSYDREYYVSFDGLLRLTLDYDMRSFPQTGSLVPNINRLKPLMNAAILEMKADVSCYQRIANAMAEFPSYTSAFSKYLTGLENAY